MDTNLLDKKNHRVLDLNEGEHEDNIMNIALLTSPTIRTPTSTEIIQICSPVVVKNTTSTSSIQHSLLSSNSIPYVPQTLVGGNNDHRRMSILPTFVSVDNSTSHLLLANVPGKNVLMRGKLTSVFLSRGIAFI